MKRSILPVFTFILIANMIFTPMINAQEEFKGKIYYPMPLPSGQFKMPDTVDDNLPAFSSDSSISNIDVPLKSLSLDSSFIKGNVGAISRNFNIENAYAYEFSDMEPVSNPAQYPMCTNVKIYMEYNGKNFVCSGTLIDPKHVLTAGHCIYNSDEGGWADEVEVAPAYDYGVNEDYGTSTAKNLMSWNGWINDEKYTHDMGIITLRRPIGALTGWLGYAYENDDEFFTDNTFHNPGYPAAGGYGGEQMYYRYGEFDYIHEGNILKFWGPSYGGQSGSGSYFKNNDGDRYVMGCHSHSTTKNNPTNPLSGQTRLNEYMFEDIQDRINDKTPGSTDLIPMRVSPGKADFVNGEPLDDLTFYVHNYSKSNFSGDFKVKFYLSTNNHISPNDRYLGTGTFTNKSINKKRTKHFYIINSATNPIKIPENTAAGEYYIGLVLDYDDADTDNNETKQWDSYRIYVNNSNNTTSTEESEMPEIAVNCFPNPATDYVRFSFENPINEAVQLEIFTSDGKLIYQTEQTISEAINVHLNNWQSGTYSYRIISDKGLKSGHFAVTK